MGVDYTAIGCLGVAFEEDALIKEQPVKLILGAPEGALYCPKTGKPVWGSKTVCRIPDFVWDGELCGDFPEGIQAEMIRQGDADGILYMGVIQRVSEYDSMEKSFHCSEVESVRVKLKGLLEPHGLWDEADFRFWTDMSIG